jgi:hypothetical protein
LIASLFLVTLVSHASGPCLSVCLPAAVHQRVNWETKGVLLVGMAQMMMEVLDAVRHVPTSM